MLFWVKALCGLIGTSQSFEEAFAEVITSTLKKQKARFNKG
jgi:hypothetical protein